MSRTPIHQHDCQCDDCRPYRPADAQSASLAASLIAFVGLAAILLIAAAVELLRAVILPASCL